MSFVYFLNKLILSIFFAKEVHENLISLYVLSFFLHSFQIRELEIQGPLGLTHGCVERGRAMHAGKVLCAQSSMVKD